MKFIDKTRQDLADIISADLQQPISLMEVDRRFIDWIELQNRRVPDAHWSVVKSKEFTANPFTSQFAAGLQIIEQNFANGKSNKAHQSRTADQVDYHDLLFNDWGILHFHLADIFESDGFCLRTGPVLFAYFDDDKVYFVDILQHGRTNRHVWADEHLLSVIDSNWPNISNRYLMNEILASTTAATQQGRIDLRQRGIASPIVINGKTYAPFGLGVNTAQGSTRFSLKAISVLRRLRQSIGNIQKKGDVEYSDKSRLSQAVPKRVRLGIASAVIRLRYRDGMLELYEEKSGQAILYSPKIVG